MVYQNENDTLSNTFGFDAVITLIPPSNETVYCHFRDRLVNLLREQLNKYKIPDEGLYYYFIDKRLHIKNCNRIMVLLTDAALSGYLSIAKKINFTLITGEQQKEETISARPIVPTTIPSLEEEKNSLPSNTAPLVDHKSIPIGRTSTAIRLFIPTRQITIKKIEWKYHLSSTPIIPLRGPDGQIRDFALFLEEEETPTGTPNPFLEVLRRGKIIHTHYAPGSHIRRLTKDEINSLHKNKPTLFTHANFMYNNQKKLELAYKLCLAKEDSRMYGFKMLDEIATIYYSNGAVVERKAALVVFAVTDSRSHKHRRGGGVSIQDDRYLVDEPFPLTSKRGVSLKA